MSHSKLSKTRESGDLHSASALVKIHVVFCCHGDKHVHPDFTLESMEDEKTLSYYRYRMTSVTERVKNLSIVWNYRPILKKNVHLFYKLFAGSCSQCLRRISNSKQSDNQRKKLGLNIFSIVGFDIFLFTKE